MREGQTFSAADEIYIHYLRVRASNLKKNILMKQKCKCRPNNKIALLRKGTLFRC
jgi:hypothetical protein